MRNSNDWRLAVDVSSDMRGEKFNFVQIWINSLQSLSIGVKTVEHT